MRQVGSKFDTLQGRYAKAKTTPYDPSPTRIEYKARRLWLTPIFRAFVRTGVPAFIIVFSALAYFSDEERVNQLSMLVTDARASVETRPEYMVNTLIIEGAGDTLAREIRTSLGFEFPISAFHVDLDKMRHDLVVRTAVSNAVVMIQSGGILAIDVDEVHPAAVWRREDTLALLSPQGDILRYVTDRTGYEDLPLIAGQGADEVLGEVAQLFAETGPIQAQLRGFVRVGERRWDIILSGDRKIALPEDEPVQALKDILVLSQAQDLLARGITLIDYRNKARPTVRLQEGALAELRQYIPIAHNGVGQ